MFAQFIVFGTQLSFFLFLLSPVVVWLWWLLRSFN